MRTGGIALKMALRRSRMIGTAMAMLALVMIPLGFALAYWMVRTLERRQAAPAPAGANRHPSRLPAVPLDDAPADVIAEVARRSR